MLPAAASQPLALHQARHYIQRLLSIINERNGQLDTLKTLLEQQTDLRRLHEDRADRAEANAAAAAHQLLLHQQRVRDPPAVPCLAPADLAALNTLPPAERDAMWLRRVFVRGEACTPLGPFELAGTYLDAFSWTGTAASGTDIVAAVARVLPAVELVQTECGPRFRGLVRVHAAPAVPQEAQTRQLRTERTAATLDPYASASEPSSSSRPATASPRPAAATTAKRKRSSEPEPELDRVPEPPTSKRVRAAQSGSVKAQDPFDLRAGVRALHDVGTSPLRVRAHEAARIPPVEKPARAMVSIATQTIGVRKTYAEAGVQARDSRHPQIGKRPVDRDALLADLAALPPTLIPPDLPPLRVPRGIVKSALPDRAVRIVHNLRRGEHGRERAEQETFWCEGEQLEYLGTYVFRPVCVGYSRAVHEALARAVLDEEVRVLSRLGVGDSDSEREGGEVGLSDGD